MAKKTTARTKSRVRDLAPVPAELQNPMKL